MLTTIAKRIQTRLSKQGVKVSLSDIRPVVNQSIKDIENPTEQEVLSVVEYFLSSATSLTVTTEEITMEGIEPVQETDDVTAENSDIDSINTLSIQDVEEAMPLAVSPKNELVANAAGELGIVLNTQEIELIASNVNYSSDDLQESLEEIKSAIIAFVRHRIALNSQMIDETLEEITQGATDGFSANSQQLTDGLQNINKQLQQQSTDFKSKVRSTLKCFQLPAAS